MRHFDLQPRGNKHKDQTCENCSFWQRNEIGRGERIPDNWPGQCMFNPIPVKRYANDKVCHQFEK